MSYFFGIYGKPEDIISVFVYECESREAALEIASKPFKDSGLGEGTEVSVMEISRTSYTTLNEIFNMVEAKKSLKEDFHKGLQGLIEAIDDGVATSTSIDAGLNGIYTLLSVYQEYDLGMIFTKRDVTRALIKAKKEKTATRDKVRKQVLSILIDRFSRIEEASDRCSVVII